MAAERKRNTEMSIKPAINNSVIHLKIMLRTIKKQGTQ
jgi:hypothetical protein